MARVHRSWGKNITRFCEARTRKAFEAATWGESQLTCQRAGKFQDSRDGKWYCKTHIDPSKRY